MCLKNETLNLTDFLYADSDAIVFGQTDNPTLHLWILNVGGSTAVALVFLGPANGAFCKSFEW